MPTRSSSTPCSAGCRWAVLASACSAHAQCIVLLCAPLHAHAGVLRAVIGNVLTALWASAAQFGVFLFFAAFMAIMTVYVWLLLPETKGVPVEEIMAVWARYPLVASAACMRHCSISHELAGAC